jgi:hypothetical protein
MSLRFSSFLCVCLLATAAAAQPEPPDYKPPDDAAALFKQGNDAYRMKKWDEAYKAFWRAFDLKKTYDIAGNLGDVELIVGKPRDAAEHLEFSLREWPAGQQAARKRTMERLEAAKQEVGTLHVEVDTDGCEISVNGQSVGTSPIKQPLFVVPGAVTVEAKHGDKHVQRTIAFDKGQERTLTLELTSAEGSATVSEPVTPAKSDPTPTTQPGHDEGPHDATSGSGSNLKTIGLITSGAVALVGAGVGVGFLMAKNSAKDDADAIVKDNDLGTTGCSASPKPSACSDLADANDRGKRSATLSTIGFIGAGVGVAGLVTFLLLPNQKKDSATSVYPLLDQHTMGLGASGRF